MGTGWGPSLPAVARRPPQRQRERAREVSEEVTPQAGGRRCSFFPSPDSSAVLRERRGVGGAVFSSGDASSLSLARA